jgi:hypothetical protein
MHEKAPSGGTSKESEEKEAGRARENTLKCCLFLRLSTPAQIQMVCILCSFVSGI